MWYLKTSSHSYNESPGHDPERDRKTLTRYLIVPAYMKYKRIHFAELFISLGEYYQCK